MPAPESSFHMGSGDGGLAQDGPIAEHTAAKELSSQVNYTSTPSKLGTAGIKGGFYRSDLLTVVMLNALGKIKDWQLSSENSLMRKFNSIIVESHGECILIQARQKDNISNNITYENLFATSPSASFSLIHYFLSFQEIKNKLNIKNAIICTNVGITIENNVATKNKVISWGIIKEHNASTEHILYSKKVANIYYTFQEDFLKEIKKQILEYVETIGQDVKDDDIRYFLSKLQIFPNFLSDQECLAAVGKEAISHIRLAKNLNAKSAFKYIKEKVRNWYEEKKFGYLDPVKANAFFCEIISGNFCDSLEEYNMAWEDHNDLFSIIFEKSSKRVFHITSQKICMLNVIKVFQALKNSASKKKVLFLNQKETIEVQRDVIQVFSKLPRYEFLVVVFPLHADDDLIELLYTVSTSSENKKIIVIAEADNKLANKISSRTDNFHKYTDNITFESLSTDTRENFLKRTVIFQGVSMSLENVMANETGNSPDFTEISHIVDSELLEKLAKRDEEITVWGTLEHLDENIKHYYINRRFIRDGQHYSEEQLCQRGEKVVLISAMPGMGKSTVLGSLAIAVKKNYPHLWVIRVDLNNYSSILKTCSKGKSQQILLTELLESQEGTKLKSEFERRLFQVRNKVVLMVDAVDEISLNYFDIVTHLLETCRIDQSINRIFITTRPHICRNLEKKLGVIAYKLEPYSLEDQLTFLAGYWIKHLDLQEEMLKIRCSHYAVFLIGELYKRIRDRPDSLFGNPLHIRMLAEVFEQKDKETSDQLQTWDGCREFLSSEKAQINLPEDFTLFKLFTDFIYKKHNIVVEDKGNTRGNALMETALTAAFNKSHEFHYILAMQVILPPNEEELFTFYQNKQEVLSSVKDYLLKLGIVQQMNGKLQFIHRTFAEYYVAKCLLLELKQENQTQQLTNFFLTEILSAQKYYTIRAMLDDFLSVELSSYLEVTQNLIRYVSGPIAYVKSQKYPSSPIHIAAKEGRLYLIKLLVGQLVESTSLRAAQVVQLNAADWLIARDCNNNIALHCAVKNGHLNVVKFLVEQHADINIINLKDSKGLTVLHCAVRRGDIEVIKFLMDKLAGVKWFEIRDSNGLTVLHYAAMGGVLQFIEFILKQYGDSSWIDVKNDEGVTELIHYTMERVPLSARRNNSHIVVFLVEQLGDTNWMDIKDSRGATMLHYAAMGGNLPVVKFLMKQLANNNWIDNRDYEGRTVLHYAAMGFNKLNSEFSSNLQVVLFLMEQLGDINWITIRDNEGLTALHYATMASNLQVVEFLMKQLASNNWIDIKDDNGLTLLHYAAMGCKVPFTEDTTNLQLIIFLIQKLAGTSWINIKDNKGLTVLHYATKTSCLEVVDFLMKQLGVNNWLDIKDNDGLTVLHYAAKRDSVIVIEFLMRRFLHKRTDWINIRDRVGSTALHVAAQECKLRVVNSLLGCLEMMDLNSLKSIKPLIIKDIYGIPHKFDFRNLDTIALSCVIKDIKIIIENRDGSFDSEGSGTITYTMYIVDDDGYYYYNYDGRYLH